MSPLEKVVHNVGPGNNSSLSFGFLRSDAKTPYPSQKQCHEKYQDGNDALIVIDPLGNFIEHSSLFVGP